MKHLLFFILISTVAKAQQLDDHIRLNQSGFYPSAPKIAVVVNDSTAEDFYVINADKKRHSL